SSALYPLWLVQQSSPLLYEVCLVNPFTYGIELVRFALYQQVNWLALGVVAGSTALFLTAAIIAYDPARGLMVRRGGAGGA
ncbi:MAG: ABC transporter permease, partial [Acetobacteraceae bacterium]